MNNVLFSELKLYKAKLITGTKTPEQILSKVDAHYLPGRILAARLAYYRELDGAICTLLRHDDDKWYRFGGFEKEYLAQGQEAFWLQEQGIESGPYFDNRDLFDKDWESGQFFGFGFYIFYDDEVQILGIYEPGKGLTPVQ